MPETALATADRVTLRLLTAVYVEDAVIAGAAGTVLSVAGALARRLIVGGLAVEVAAEPEDSGEDSGSDTDSGSAEDEAGEADADQSGSDDADSSGSDEDSASTGLDQAACRALIHQVVGSIDDLTTELTSAGVL